MSDYNPYEPPRAGQLFPDESKPDSNTVPPAIIEILRQTKPWVSLLGVLGFVGSALMLLAGFGIALSGAAGGRSPFGDKSVIAGVGLGYIVLAGVNVIPALSLFRYGSRIGRFLRDPSVDRLGTALSQQRSFWRFVGISTLLLLGFYVLAVVGVVIAGALGAARRTSSIEAPPTSTQVSLSSSQSRCPKSA